MFLEGPVTEQSYIDWLNWDFGSAQRFSLKVYGYGKPREVVEAAIEHRTKHLSRAKERRDPSREPETWCLFDRDEHGYIDSVVPKAVKNGIQVAFSHPCFELWLLLHFQQLATPLSGRCTDLESKLQQYVGFENYKKIIRKVEWGALAGRSDDARKRALQLVGQCPSGGCGPEEHTSRCVPTNRDPSTDVWKLLDSLELRY